MPDPSSSSFNVGAETYVVDKYIAKGGTAKRPVVVVFHGVDGLGGSSGRQIGKFAGQLAGAGYVVFVPHYFDARDGADSLPVAQLFERRVPRLGLYPPRIAGAVDYALRGSDADSTRLGLIGFSLGGGLMLNFAESVPPATIKAVVDFFGYIPDPKICNNANRLPPTLILHHQHDDVVKVATSSQKLVDALAKTSVRHEHHFYDKDLNPAALNHTFLPDGTADTDSRARAVKWMNTYLKS